MSSPQHMHLTFFQPVGPNAKKPTQATPGSAAVDLYSYDIIQEPGPLIIVDIGVRTAFSPQLAMLVFSRSGYARKYGIRLANSVAVIDSDYRGNIQLMFEHNPEMCSRAEAMEHLAPGNRVAQAVFVPAFAQQWVETNELPSSLRGVGGFGSTGQS